MVLVGASLLVGACSDDPEGSSASGGCEPVMVGNALTDHRQYDLVRILPNGEVELLTDDRLSFGPALSPDGTWLAFTRGVQDSFGESDGYAEHGIVTMDLEGDVLAEFDRPTGHDDSGASISPDGEQVVFVRTDRELRESHLVVAQRDGSRQHDLGGSFSTLQHHPTSWSPDGERIAALALDDDAERTSLLVIEAASGDIELRQDVPWATHLDWSADGSSILVSTSNYESPAPPVEVSLDGEVRQLDAPPNASWTNAYYDEDTIVVLRKDSTVEPEPQVFEQVASDGAVDGPGTTVASRDLIGGVSATNCFRLGTRA